MYENVDWKCPIHDIGLMELHTVWHSNCGKPWNTSMIHRYCIKAASPQYNLSAYLTFCLPQTTNNHCRKNFILRQLKIIYPHQSMMSLATLDVRMPLGLSTRSPADLVSDHRTPQSPYCLHNALQSQSSSQAELRENRRAYRSQWSSCSCHILRPGQAFARRHWEVGRSASHPPATLGGTTQRLPRSRSLGRDAAQGAPYLPTVWDRAELWLCLQGGSQREVRRWDYECYLVFDKGWEGDWWGR